MLVDISIGQLNGDNSIHHYSEVKVLERVKSYCSTPNYCSAESFHIPLPEDVVFDILQIPYWTKVKSINWSFSGYGSLRAILTQQDNSHWTGLYLKQQLQHVGIRADLKGNEHEVRFFITEWITNWLAWTFMHHPFHNNYIHILVRKAHTYDRRIQTL